MEVDDMEKDDRVSSDELGSSPTETVITPNRNIRIDSHKAGDGYVKLELEGFTFLAAYISPNIGLDAFKLKIDALFRGTPNRGGKYIIVGDLNAKSASWESPIKDRRGAYVEEWMTQTSAASIIGKSPTFVRGSSASHIDVTLVSENFLRVLRLLCPFPSLLVL
ncbi:hypothetical protein WA026_022234 [Henosepilachna vigintioctopunctata]|uniref:Endonuclease/exonuclease/phosphatase domain-containing protein n=1 Tax=Henosepilachna vigintioctopunctata TaxID=420089 RepID=A0AAW1URL0_9CUCU